MFIPSSWKDYKKIALKQSKIPSAKIVSDESVEPNDSEVYLSETNLGMFCLPQVAASWKKILDSQVAQLYSKSSEQPERWNDGDLPQQTIAGDCSLGLCYQNDTEFLHFLP